MVNVNQEICTGCSMCVRACPLEAIIVTKRKANATEKCVQCGICIKVCKFNAITKTDIKPESAKCSSCPVQCQIKPGFTGACQRYRNIDGTLVRNRSLVISNENVGKSEYAGYVPLITAVGAGTNYPCSKPAPYIVESNVDGVDVVTVVTEAPLSYSGIKVKVDTNVFLGEEGTKIKKNGKIIGALETEEYGSKMLAIGGANLLTGTDGYIVADTVVKLANGEAVEVWVDKTKILLQTGKAPVINGIEDTKMRVGCGSATVGLFARDLKGVVDEAIILDHHVVGLFSEHLAGANVGMKYSGVVPRARKSTLGRYFGEHGNGWGGTDIANPIDAISKIDMNLAKVGMKILVTETTGQKAAFFEIQHDGTVTEIAITKEAKAVVDKIAATCEPSMVSVIYADGTGGSARARVSNEPLMLSKAVHEGKVKLTIGGVPAYVYPGGGINFIVDTGKIVSKAFSWVPTPATVAPVEYTMKKEDYAAIGGHMDQIHKLEDVKKQFGKQ